MDIKPNRPVARLLLTGLATICLLFFPKSMLHAAPASPKPVPDAKQILQDRKQLLEQVSAISGIPWYNLAAVDQYERTLVIAKKKPARPGLLAISISEWEWAGLTNPNPQDQNTQTISLFGGKGRDGNGDGLADRNDDLDVLTSLTVDLLKYGVSPEHFHTGLEKYYHNSRAVQRIEQFAKLYATFDTLDLDEHTFVLPLGSSYSYRSTWGASRGWGGDRIHEGTDLFAGYGVPVRSASYGIIEIKGWNSYGGWRVGVRDLNNVYHYFAHLSSFYKGLSIGDIVKPGQIIGYVGSSGYGKPGTSGKFPPHLHYGLYRDNGTTDWSFDPYPHLRKWEREERQRGRKP